jgi:predicted nucleotidyltransferase
MRLRDSEKNVILEQTSRFAPDGDTYLFGSRTDPAARGGDIDLLLLTETKLPLRLIREMRRAILSEIGEQKLDIVNFARGQQHPFKDVAMENALKL